MQNKTHLSKLGFVLTLVAFSLCFILGASTPALAGTQKAGSSSIKTTEEKTVSHQFTLQEQQAALAYWTPERMKSATDAEMLVKAPAQNEPHQQAPTGPALTGAPFIPQGVKMQAPGKGIHPDDASQLPHFLYSQYPYRAFGKVFFTLNGGYHSCSGTAVNSKNKSVVDTAGHCVVAGGSDNQWSSNWIFCPEYYYGNGPFGCWAARGLVSIYGWSHYGWLAYDFGAAIMSANGYGNIVNVVGGTGWQINLSYYQTFYAFGYPADPPFDGNTMWYAASPLVGTDNPSPGPATMGINNNMTGGSSGGGWLISINGNIAYLNGHNDYGHIGDPIHMFSPYYNSSWYNYVYNPAQNA